MFDRNRMTRDVVRHDERYRIILQSRARSNFWIHISEISFKQPSLLSSPSLPSSLFEKSPDVPVVKLLFNGIQKLAGCA